MEVSCISALCDIGSGEWKRWCVARQSFCGGNGVAYDKQPRFLAHIESLLFGCEKSYPNLWYEESH